MVASIAADGVDVVIMEAAGARGFFWGETYHPTDKILDTYYLAFAAAVSLKWQETLFKKVAIFLFLWRFLGVVIFEITGIRQIILFAPSIFENFYLIVAGIKQFAPKFSLDSAKKLLIILVIATIPKLVQEYFMHFREVQTWRFVKENIFQWR